MDPSLPTLSNMLDPDDDIDHPFKEKKQKQSKKENNNTNNEYATTKEEEEKIDNKNIPPSSPDNNNDTNEKKDEKKEVVQEKVEPKMDKKIIIEVKKEVEEEAYTVGNSNNINKVVKDLKMIRELGNNFYKKNLFDEAIDKYSEGYKIINEKLVEINRNRMWAYHPKIQEFMLLSLHIMNYLSLSYIQKDKYKESIELDKKIISLDPKYDRSYARLFQSYLKMNQMTEAVFFGDILIKNFSSEIREKYSDLIPNIEKEKQNLENQYEIEKEKKRKERQKNLLKNLVPLLLLLIGMIYFRYFRKK